MSIRRLIPNLFTAGNLVCGVLAIIFILDNDLRYAPLFILVAALCDLLDGLIARVLDVTSEMGKQLDSLADMVTFGVAPGILVYKLLAIPFETDGQFHYFTLAGLLIPAFALFRLAKFNLDKKQNENFIGIPTPAVAIFFFGYVGILHDYFASPTAWKADIVRSWVMSRYVLISMTVFFSVLMVVPLRMFSLKFKHGKWKGNEIRYIFLTISAILLATLFWWSLPIIILLYVILSLIDNILNKSVKDEIQS